MLVAGCRGDAPAAAFFDEIVSPALCSPFFARRKTRSKYPLSGLGLSPSSVGPPIGGRLKKRFNISPHDESSCVVWWQGFMTEDFWYKFSLPLLQVAERLATCTTTPPPVDSFFAQFIENVRIRNEEHHDYFFTLVNHSLSCAACIEQLIADKCCHRLHFIPPWKSLQRFVQMKAIIPKKQLATFQTEVCACK